MRSNSNSKLTIVLPCYNESGNIPSIFNRFRDILSHRKDVEVILVNNGSSDNSEEIFNQELTQAKNSFAKVIHVPINKGYGFGIMTGVHQAAGDVIAWTHADMQTDPNDVLLAYDKFLLHDSQRSILKGKRISRGFFDTFFTFGMSVISSMMLRVKLDDINAQPKMFHRNHLDLLRDAPDDFSLDLYLLYMARTKGYTIIEQEVHFGDRLHGTAKGGGSLKGKVKLIVRTWKYIVKLKMNLVQ
jgi:glycosyltransferase involved in cell wall biosynthesis